MIIVESTHAQVPAKSTPLKPVDCEYRSVSASKTGSKAKGKGDNNKSQPPVLHPKWARSSGCMCDIWSENNRTSDNPKAVPAIRQIPSKILSDFLIGNI